MLFKKNILDLESNKYLYSQVTDNNFPWFFLSNSALAGDKDDKTFSWFHLLYDNKTVNSTWYPLFELSIQRIIKTFKLKGNVKRVRLGLHTPMNKQTIGSPHVDSLDKHKTILYYINNSDGDTFFYNKKKIIKKITPVANSGICFDGSIYHSSSKPIKTIRRIVININLCN